MYEDADMEDYGFEYSDEEPEEQDVDIENQYYNSKGIEFVLFLTLTPFSVSFFELVRGALLFLHDLVSNFLMCFTFVFNSLMIQTEVLILETLFYNFHCDSSFILMSLLCKFDILERVFVR